MRSIRPIIFLRYYETKTSQLTYTAEVNWKSWLEQDLNSHLRDTGPLYQLSYQVYRDWRQVLSNLSARDILATT